MINIVYIYMIFYIIYILFFLLFHVSHWPWNHIQSTLQHINISLFINFKPLCGGHCIHLTDNSCSYLSCHMSSACYCFAIRFVQSARSSASFCLNTNSLSNSIFSTDKGNKYWSFLSIDSGARDSAILLFTIG